MRIELPNPSWAESLRVQDDAHTLTLPAQRPVMLPDALRAGAAEAGDGVRVAVTAEQPASLTLTF